MLKVLEIEKKNGYYWASESFRGSQNRRGFEKLRSAVWFVLMGRY